MRAMATVRSDGPTGAMAAPEIDGVALLARVAEARCRLSFADLFGHFGPRIKGFMMRSGASEDLAEEVVQETMVTVWTKAHLFDPVKAGASTWIFTIARNKRIDLIRRRNRPEPDPNDPMFVPDPPESGIETVTRKQDERRIRQAISELPPEQAQIVMLSFFEELPHSAIAERLDLPLGTVKSRLRLAFRKVRDSVGEDS
mgnify:CR=1 FL=1